MSVGWDGKTWIAIADDIHLGSVKINEIWMGNKKIYPDAMEYYWIQTPSNTKYIGISVAAIWFYKNKMHYSVYLANNPFSIYWDAVRQIWVFESWGGLNHIDGRNIWTDGYFVFLKENGVYYRLNPDNDTWEILNWDIDTSHTNYLTYMWTDGTDIYYSRSSHQYILNKSTLNWSPKSWQGSGLNYPNSQYIWSDGENIYYSHDSYQYKLDKTNLKWTEKTWYGYSGIEGSLIWTDGTDMYFTPSTSYTYNSYILNKENDTWESITWNVQIYNPSNYIWTDGINCFNEYGGPYILDKLSKQWVDTHMYNHLYKGCEEPNYTDNNAVTLVGDDGSYSGTQYIWNDGTNYYITSYWSYGSELYYKNFIIDPINDVWNDCLYNSIVKNPEYLWSDGENIYYSRSRTEQYIFNKSTKTWSEKTWYYKVDDGHTFDIKDIEAINAYRYSDQTTKRFADFIPYGSRIWTDGTNVYTSCRNTYAMSYNNIYNNFILNKSTSTWERIIIDGISEVDNWIDPMSIWSDGNNIYRSFNKVFNKSTKSFSTKEWNIDSGLHSVDNVDIFTDGDNIYVRGLVAKEGTDVLDSVLCIVNTKTSTIKKPSYSDRFWNTLTITGDVVERSDYSNYYVFHDTIYSRHGLARKVYYKKFNRNTALARAFSIFRWKRYLL